MMRTVEDFRQAFMRLRDEAPSYEDTSPEAAGWEVSVHGLAHDLERAGWHATAIGEARELAGEIKAWIINWQRERRACAGRAGA